MNIVDINSFLGDLKKLMSAYKDKILKLEKEISCTPVVLESKKVELEIYKKIMVDLVKILKKVKVE